MEDEAVGAGGADFEGHFGRFDEGEVVVYVAYGYVEGYRELVGRHGVADHGLHIGICGVGLVVGKLADDETSDIVEKSAQTELVEDSFDLVYRFRYVFEEEDRVGFQYIVGRVDKFGEHGEVASEKSAGGYAEAVVFVRWKGICRPVAAQESEERRRIRVGGAFHDLSGHR